MQHLTVGLAQIAPVWLNKKATLEKMSSLFEPASQQTVDLLVFGESLLPGYPFWVELTEGAQFESELQKQCFQFYVEQSVCIERGDLVLIQQQCKQHQIACYLGCIEQPQVRGKSVYCSMVYIDKEGVIQSVHRKLMPTYEERLVWSTGDGHGLRTHSLNQFTLGGLNCWENWMPMARASLYGQGEDCHVAIWPGNLRNTEQITRFIAKESRSFVISVSGLFHVDNINPDFPGAELMADTLKKQNPRASWLANGGSCVASPNGEWLLEPIIEREGLFVVELDHAEVLKERQSFDPSGHYSRPDVLQLSVNRTRQQTVVFNEHEK